MAAGGELSAVPNPYSEHTDRIYALAYELHINRLHSWKGNSVSVYALGTQSRHMHMNI